MFILISRYKGTIGTNVNHDPVRKAEEDRAIEHKDIYFAGPRRLRFGDTGILGKVPIVMGNKVVAVTTVRTLLPCHKKNAFKPMAQTSNKFTYQLLKTHGKDRFRSSHCLIQSRLTKSEYVDLDIPEGDWLLRVSYAVMGTSPANFHSNYPGWGFYFHLLLLCWHTGKRKSLIS
jgi:hypothetical protein